MTGGAGNDTLDGSVAATAWWVVRVMMSWWSDKADTIQEDSSLIGGKNTVRAWIGRTFPDQLCGKPDLNRVAMT